LPCWPARSSRSALARPRETALDDTPSGVIRVSVLGGHPVVRGVVRLACREAPDLELVSESDRLDGAVDAIRSTNPDIAVIDLDMPEGDSIWILRELRRAEFAGRILVLTDRKDGASVLEALRHGADGCLAKAGGLRGVAAALRRLAAGERLVDPALERAAMGQLGRFATVARESSEAAAGLTSREREVLTLLADGHTMRQMGRRLGISPRTVERHVAGLYRKLEVRSRVQAVTRAAALDLIDLR
jgi:DNA-binding NarL/FixJ family response regulator